MIAENQQPGGLFHMETKQLQAASSVYVSL